MKHLLQHAYSQPPNGDKPEAPQQVSEWSTHARNTMVTCTALVSPLTEHAHPSQSSLAEPPPPVEPPRGALPPLMNPIVSQTQLPPAEPSVSWSPLTPRATPAPCSLLCPSAVSPAGVLCCDPAPGSDPPILPTLPLGRWPGSCLS